MAQFALAEGEPQRVKPINPLETAAQVLGIKQAQQGIRTSKIQQDILESGLRKSTAANTASEALRQFLATNPDPSTDDLLRVGGPEAIPIIKDLLEQQKAAIANNAEKLKNHQALITELGNLSYGLKQLPLDQRPAAHQQGIQRMFQAGLIDEATARQALQSHDTDQELDQVIATTPAIQKQLEQAQKELNDKAERNLKNAQVLEVQARTAQIGHVPGVDIPFSPEVQAQKKISVPGTDVPFSPAVEAQKKRIALDTRTDPAVTVTTRDKDGNAVTKVIPRSQALGQEFPVAPTTQERNFEMSLGKIDPIMKSISELSERINTQQGVIAKLYGGAEKAKAKINLDDDVAEYESLISGFTPMVARAVGHTGVLTQQDVDSVKALFPRPGDSKNLRDRKIARVKMILGAQNPGAGGQNGTSLIVPGGALEKLLQSQPQQ